LSDLKPTNILLELENPHHDIDRYLEEIPPRLLGNDEKIPLREVISTPPIHEIRDIHIRIIDLGVGMSLPWAYSPEMPLAEMYYLASWIDRRLTDDIQSPALRAPEVSIGAPWGTPVDIWSLGCLVSLLLLLHILHFFLDMLLVIARILCLYYFLCSNISIISRGGKGCIFGTA
jgi:serine/threonine-protein kinase SRPK3